MLKRSGFLLVLSALLPLDLQAFTCFLTIAKDNCWLNYDVQVNIADLATSKVAASVLVPKGQTWSRQVFSCQPAQTFAYSATFQPIIWQNQANVVYRAQKYWGLPKTIGPNETAWEMKVCYSGDFTETPLPPESTGHCACDFTVIPPPKP